MVRRYAHVTARLRREIADRLNMFLSAPMRLGMRLMAAKPTPKGIFAHIAWSDVVIRGGVEPRTFRFSGATEQ